ncbi:protein virilizer [Chelonus insularis]|uniref:protein virilizer n=1 Tax=Chelonus insularis TaxID=460826 RepID=UPI0015889266|nr:protein virilizer [Chelonus insularis]
MDNVELLFFDTFSHDISEELNLDLVQFPKPVYISEVRIIPLGARVQADFPGGVRLGATNPSQFEIEFFVNDLSKPGASTFESLGGLEYKQNVNIQLECDRKQIPTDGLVLRGWYTTITLAVYGSLTKSLSNPPESTPPASVATVPIPASEPEPPPSIPQNAETQQPDWFYENQSQAHTAPQPEPRPAPTPSPTIQPVPPVETASKPVPNEPVKPEQPWTEEIPEEQNQKKRPSSPPSESLVSLSPESISAEEEEGERELEEITTEAVEPFEPILSDEELMNDDLPAPPVEFEFDIPEDIYTIEPPDFLDIQKFSLKAEKEQNNQENTEKTREILQTLVKSVNNFHSVTGQEKETFVHNCETLCTLLGSFFQADNNDLQDIAEIVKAGLDMDLARAQPQPTYKVRHIKIGVRLAEVTCGLEKGDEVILKVEAPKKLLTLCTRENVALPVKLAAIRALDAALISPKIVENYLYTENLYKFTLKMLDEAKLARLKYALTSLIRKIHIYELLEKNYSYRLHEWPIRELTQAYVCAPTLMAQPKRQLPASRQMEFDRERNRNPQKHLVAYFEHHDLICKLLLILVSSDSPEGVIRHVRIFFKHLTNTSHGLLYLLKEPEKTKLLLKALRYQKVGLGSEIAWRLQVVYCLLQIKYQSASSKVDWLLVKKLHSFLVYPDGLRAVVTVLSMDSFLDILIPLLSDRDLSEFVAEIISTMIRFNSDNVKVLQGRAGSLLEEARSQGLLKDVVPYLNIAASSANWNYGDVSNLVGTIKKYAEKAPSLPGELITACRILHYLIFPAHGDTDPLEAYTELKHVNALTQLFAADGLTALISVMTHLTTFYEQPYVHKASYTGRRGLLLMSILVPCVKLTRALLDRLVRCMATGFKDLTPVVPLLGVYALVDAMSPTAQTRFLADEIAETLLLFTNTVDSDGAGNVAKSLWTQMLGEVLKMISASPCNFVPGLKLLARLLPPILYIEENLVCDTRELMLRKLWSAHLQAQASNLTETLKLLCASWNETVLTLLANVCKQLSDLAAPTALIVGRCFLDRMLASAPLENHGPTLALLGDVATHPPFKATLLTLLNPTSRAQVKSDQKYLPVIDMMCSALKNTTNAEVQAEILEIFGTLCDHTLTIMDEEKIDSLEICLTHSIPSKEPLLSIISAFIDILANANKHAMNTSKSALRVLLSLTEHNYGLYHVKSCLENNLGALKSFLTYVATLEIKEEEKDKEKTKISEIERLIVTFLENLIACSELYRRSLSLRLPQLATLIMWDKNEHPLQKIPGAQELVNELKATIEGKEEKEPIPEMLEPLLPTPDALLNQFAQRSMKRSSTADFRARKRHYNRFGAVESIAVDIMALVTELLPSDFNLLSATQLLCSKKPVDDSIEIIQTKEESSREPRDTQKSSTVSITKTKMPFVTPMRGRAQFVNTRGGLATSGAGRGADPFRSRPPNTSRPPSLHVDDFVALETCGAQPTGPTGYNKLSVRGTGPPRGVITGPRCRPWVSEPRPPYMR